YPTQPAQRQADPKAVAWAQRNPWFGQDEPMTLTAFSIHKTMVEDEGIDPQSEEYYQELDKRMRANFPQRFKAKASNEEEAPRQPQARQQRPGVAAQRGAAPAGGTTNGKKTIKLTPSQVAIARKLNVPLAE